MYVLVGVNDVEASPERYACHDFGRGRYGEECDGGFDVSPHCYTKLKYATSSNTCLCQVMCSSAASTSTSYGSKHKPIYF